uniref:aspartate aminotransferase family protein n=1 Tax=Roseibium sp. TaxID=1936156 RepID=UPI003D116DDF
MTAHSNIYPTKALQALDAAHHWHPFSDMKSLNEEGSRVITSADGVWLSDSEGNRIMDGMAGLWCVQVGHGRTEIADAVYKQMKELSYYNTFFKTTHPPVIALSEKIAKLAPAHMNKVFYCSSGSEANDTVFRMVRTYWDKVGKPEKKIIIGRWNGYHGSTLAGTSLGGMKAMHFQGDLPVQGVHHIDQPYWFGEGYEMSPEEFGIVAARKLEEAIDELGEDKIAAFIAEPIQGAGGVIIPPSTYWPEIRRILKERDILFVSDEVICGFGRLGEWFGSTYYGMEPDLMPIAKGLTSGYLPMGGVIVSDRVAEGLMLSGDEFYHGYTYSGHPACAAAALANLEIMEREGLVDRVKNDIGPYLKERWLKLGEHPLVGEARMEGLVGALELVGDKKNPHKPFADVGTVGTICRDNSFKHGMVM